MTPRELLQLRFGYLGALILRSHSGLEHLPLGVLGDGNKGTKGMGGGAGRGVEYDEQALILFGRADRALLRISVTHRYALELAYGDLGEAITEAGMQESQRWMAVGPLTPLACRLAAEWGRLNPTMRERDSEGVVRDVPAHGDPVVRWWAEVTRSKAACDKAQVAAVGVEARALLDQAEGAFVAALVQVAGARRPTRAPFPPPVARVA